jgi:large subunit ribosomal protein L31
MGFGLAWFVILTVGVSLSPALPLIDDTSITLGDQRWVIHTPLDALPLIPIGIALLVIAMGKAHLQHLPQAAPATRRAEPPPGDGRPGLSRPERRLNDLRLSPPREWAVSSVRLRIWHTDSATAAVPVHVLRHRLNTGRPGDRHERGESVKPEIHPDYVVTNVTCTCGNTFETRSTAENGVIHADVCSNCHPFYTGKQKILDTGGRVARFEKRFGKKAAGNK